jgi:hypothetical protein
VPLTRFPSAPAGNPSGRFLKTGRRGAGSGWNYHEANCPNEAQGPRRARAVACQDAIRFMAMIRFMVVELVDAPMRLPRRQVDVPPHSVMPA